MANLTSPCQVFWISETCYRHNPKLQDENEEIADLRVGLIDAHRTWGFGLCFLHRRNGQGHAWNPQRVHRIDGDLELNLRGEPRNATGPRDHGERRGGG